LRPTSVKTITDVYKGNSTGNTRGDLIKREYGFVKTVRSRLRMDPALSCQEASREYIREGGDRL